MMRENDKQFFWGPHDLLYLEPGAQSWATREKKLRMQCGVLFTKMRCGALLTPPAVCVRIVPASDIVKKEIEWCTQFAANASLVIRSMTSMAWKMTTQSEDCHQLSNLEPRSAGHATGFTCLVCTNRVYRDMSEVHDVAETVVLGAVESGDHIIRWDQSVYPASTASFFHFRVILPLILGSLHAIESELYCVVGCWNLLPILFRNVLFRTMRQRTSGLLMPRRPSACRNLLSIQCEFANCDRTMDSQVC